MVGPSRRRTGAALLRGGAGAVPTRGKSLIFQTPNRLRQPFVNRRGGSGGRTGRALAPGRDVSGDA